MQVPELIEEEEEKVGGGWGRSGGRGEGQEFISKNKERKQRTKGTSNQ